MKTGVKLLASLKAIYSIKKEKKMPLHAVKEKSFMLSEQKIGEP